MPSALMQKLYVPDKGDYQTSGNYPLTGWIATIALTAIITTICAFIYSIAVSYIPIIYFNALMTAALGLVIGYSTYFISRIFLIRNNRIRFVIAISIAIWAIIFQWYVHLFVITRGINSIQNIFNEGPFLFDFKNLKIIFSRLYIHGSWAAFGFPVSGLYLLSIWLVEALIILGSPILILLNNPIPPFSEKLNKWYSKITLSQDFAYISAINSFINELRNSKGQNLFHYPKGDGNRHSLITIYYVKHEPQAFLCADNIYITKGQGSNKDVDPIVRFIKIPVETAEQLITRYGKRKWSYLNL